MDYYLIRDQKYFFESFFVFAQQDTFFIDNLASSISYLKFSKSSFFFSCNKTLSSSLIAWVHQYFIANWRKKSYEFTHYLVKIQEIKIISSVFLYVQLWSLIAQVHQYFIANWRQKSYEFTYYLVKIQKIKIISPVFLTQQDTFLIVNRAGSISYLKFSKFSFFFSRNKTSLSSLISSSIITQIHQYFIANWRQKSYEFTYYLITKSKLFSQFLFTRNFDR